MTAVTPAALTLTGPPMAAFAPSRNPRMTGPTLTEECRAIQTDYPAWHVWHGDGGWVYATHDWADGTATTLDSHGPQLMGHVIAEFEHHRAFAGLMGGAA